jgi:hypothetical protein
VVAELQQGFVASEPWSPALDGILAYWQVREMLGDDAFALGATGHVPLVTPDLPLERVAYGDDWWWACSSPISGEAIRFERWYHRRFDLAMAIDHLPGTKRVLVTAGAYKSYRNRDLVTVPRDRTVTWHCIGDRAAIERLLRRCGSIGRGGGRGNGVVRSWTVTPDGDPDVARRHRPLPLDYALSIEATGMTMPWGIRPPGRAPELQRLCVMP